MFVTAIIAAGGRGRRLGGELKQLRTIGGRAILDRSISMFLMHPAIAEVVVALPQELVESPPEYLRSIAPEAFALQTPVKPVRIVAGGGRRQDSVANAFRAAAAASDVIVIHDAARPFASADLISRTIAAAVEAGAALAALPARDTVKRAAAEEAEDPAETGSQRPRGHRTRTVAETLPRDTIFLAQTPQAFRRDVLEAALALAERDGGEATDEAALAERAGKTVRLVDGEATNIKITTSDDLLLAEAIAADRSREGSARQRIGTGYDLHRLVPGRPLILGGVTIPSDRGALGHSDADVVCHAVTDAILGAACLGDIGRHFPDSDERWSGASSLDLLARAVALARHRDLQVGNVDVTIVLEQPKIADHVGAMRAAVAAAIGIGVERVSIKGKTNEGVDAIGRGEAVAAHAIALLK